MKIKASLLSVVFIFLLAVYGCGQGGTTISDLPDEGQDKIAEDKPESAPMARVAFSAAFPERYEVGRALIDENTVEIRVEWHEVEDEYWWWYGDANSITLTPDNPTATVTIPPGDYWFWAKSFDTGGNPLDSTSSAGTLVAGANTVLLTFIKGEWDFVAADGTTPAPVTLIGGRSLGGFQLAPWLWGAGVEAASQDVKKASPQSGLMGWSEYYFTWFSADRIAFSETTFATHAQWFTGGTATDSNRSSFHGGFYNLTQDRGDFDPDANDRMIGIIGEDVYDYYDYYDTLPGIPEDTTTPDVSQHETSTVADAITITGNIVEFTFVSRTAELIMPDAATAARAPVKMMSMADALEDALRLREGIRKAQTQIGDLTFTWSKPVVVGTDADGDGVIDQGEWDLWDRTTDEHGNVYYRWGSVWDRNGDGTIDFGEYSWGLYCTAAPGVATDTGEWEDWNQNGVVDPWEHWDQNNDGVIDYGTYSFSHFVTVTTTFSDVWVHPFTAKGSQLPGTDIIVQ